MATLREAIKERLGTIQELTDLVGTSVHHLLSEAQQRPYVVFGRSGVEPGRALGGPTGRVVSRVAFDVVADSADSAEKVAIALRKGLDGWRGRAAGLEVGGANRVNESEAYDDEIKAYRIRQDYTIQHQED